MLDLIFANDEFDDNLQLEMSKLLLKFIEANQKLFSLQIQNHSKTLKLHVEQAERKKMRLIEENRIEKNQDNLLIHSSPHEWGTMDAA